VREGEPSRTAWGAAVHRAVHPLLDDPVLFNDPLALRILGVDREAVLAEAAPRSRLRLFVALRHRTADDTLAAAYLRGTRQCVVLGAGLDTIAYRNRHADLRVFEVDHPATQEWKRQRLAAENIAIPSSVTYAAVDFNTQTLADGLRAANFQADQPAFFSWLGVTMYLEPQTVLDTLRLIHTMHAENGIVFDYAVQRHLLNTMGKLIFDAITSRVAKAGEPFRGLFVPSELNAAISQIGYRHIEDLDSPAINGRYFANRTDNLKVAGAMGRLCCARS
jgi:methyltransferase (TIGR00027 family)